MLAPYLQVTPGRAPAGTPAAAPSDEDLLGTLRSVFGHHTFRPPQLRVVRAIAAGRDVSCVQATGAGKSVCFQLLPVCLRRTGLRPKACCVVVSPLISLMVDQVAHLVAMGINACHLSAAQTDPSVLPRALAGAFALIYVTPERLQGFARKELKALRSKLCCFAVDEAHCISSWGHDFRSSYLRLSVLREEFPEIPIIAATATATKRVRREIASQLCLSNQLDVVTTFDRPNLYFAVDEVTSNAETLDTLVRMAKRGVFSKHHSSIIYVPTTALAENIAEHLRRRGKVVSALAYHGRLRPEKRAEVHRAFISDQCRVMVATIAFGMGIDKPNIRLVVHAGLPQSLEAYYQHIGRAGRDGEPSRALLLFKRSDAQQQVMLGQLGRKNGSTAATALNGAAAATLASNEKLDMIDRMLGFATDDNTCRRERILRYFGQTLPRNTGGEHRENCCDVCSRARDEACASSSSSSSTSGNGNQAENYTKPSRLFLLAVQECGEHWGLGMYVDIVRGSRNKKLLNSFGSSSVLRLTQAKVPRVFHCLWWIPRLRDLKRVRSSRRWA